MITKVLLVEDNPGDIHLIKRMLIDAEGKFNIENVKTIQSALELLIKNGIDVILLDLLLPDSHGLESFFRIYRQAPQVPIVVLTGSNDETMAIEAVQKGAQDYLVKGQVDGNLLGRALRYSIERKRAEEELRFLSSITQQVSDAIIVTDPEFKIKFANKSAENLYGYSWVDLIGLNHELLSVEALTEETKKEIFHVLSSGKNWSRILRHRRRNGSVFSCEMGISPLYDKQGKLVAYVSIRRDITERIRMEETLNRLRAQELVLEEMKKLDQLKNEFIMAVTHEMRTPMTPLKTYLEMLLDGTLGSVLPEQRKHLETMARNIDRLARFAEDIFSLSRLEADRYRLKKEYISLLSLVHPLTKLLKEEADRKKVNLIVEIASGTSAIADDDALHTIMIHLMHNAVKYSPEKSLVIIAARGGDGKFIEVSVTDSGPGIPVEMREKVFGKFVQIRLEDGPGYKGIGVGLALCKGLVEGMGGKIWVEAAPGGGSAFIFTLPEGQNSQQGQDDD